MEIEEITLNNFTKEIQNSDFETAYNKLVLEKDIDDVESIILLKTAIILLNFGDIDLQKLGYKIIVMYSNKSGDFRPLYDFAINKGYMPISKLIEQKYSINNTDNHFFRLFLSAYHETYKENGYYVSNGQKKLIEFSNNNKSNFVLVAPTSYGKSEIIVDKVYNNLNKKVCIIVPSKALLAQTKKRLLNRSSGKNLQRIITNPEMYQNSNKEFVATLTQERLLRLLQKNPDLKIDLVLIDEAHNLFGNKDKDGDKRAILLAQTIMILKKRNDKVILNFFSPFISNPQSLKIQQLNYELVSQSTDEFIKTEKIIVYNTGKTKIYNQFTNSFLETGLKFKDEFELLHIEKARKNIIYLNRPRDIEETAVKLKDSYKNDENNIKDIISTISEYVHPNYKLIDCIKKGIVYHHGGMPEIIRLYVEELFSKHDFLEFIVTSSTLLEGINIPAEKIFLLSLRKGRGYLSKSNFKNLIGRVNRFSEIFNNKNDNLKLLEPNVYIVNNDHIANNANIEKFVADRAKSDVKIIDEINNLLLKPQEKLTSIEEEELFKTLEYLENIEPNTTSIENVNYVKTEIGQLCYKNNIFDFDIQINEKQLFKNFLNYKNLGVIISDCDELINAIFKIFLYEIEIKSENIKRLNNIPARKFYSMILNWRSRSASFKEMISSFLKYWDKLEGEDLVIYVGEKWGEEKSRKQWDEEKGVYKGWKKLYVDLRLKNKTDRINLAIVKITEEQEFVEFNLLKYIDILFELKLIKSEFYDEIKYGTSDERIITLLKNGFSLELAKCVSQELYSDLISINSSTSEVIVNRNIVDLMEENLTNKILIFEIKYHTKE